MSRAPAFKERKIFSSYGGRKKNGENGYQMYYGMAKMAREKTVRWLLKRLLKLTTPENRGY